MLDGCTTTGKWGTILVPSCLAALTFSSSFMQQTARLCICLGGPTAVPVAPSTAVLGTSLGSWGCDALWEHWELTATMMQCGRWCVPGPGKPSQAANGARGTDCSMAAVSQPHGL